MTPAEHLTIMNDPRRWPLRVVLALAHATELDDWGTARVGFLALGHGSTLYLANLDRLPRRLRSQAQLDAALAGLPSIRFLSFEALHAAGWRVD